MLIFAGVEGTTFACILCSAEYANKQILLTWRYVLFRYTVTYKVICIKSEWWQPHTKLQQLQLGVHFPREQGVLTINAWSNWIITSYILSMFILPLIWRHTEIHTYYMTHVENFHVGTRSYKVWHTPIISLPLPVSLNVLRITQYGEAPLLLL